MKIIGVIPARYQSSRFPGKPLAEICGKPMIWWVYNTVSKVPEMDDVFVATDDQRIYNTITSFGGKAVMTSATHKCGTDRIAECANALALNENDVILNIQGDEPLIRIEMIRDLISVFDSPDVCMGTLKRKIDNPDDLNNPNVAKVICDCNGDAIYFSRYAIPYVRDGIAVDHFRHIGIYGYRKWLLVKFAQMQRSSLEMAESLEQLRIIQNGMKIRVKETSYDSVGVDTLEQLQEVERRIRSGY